MIDKVGLLILLFTTLAVLGVYSENLGLTLLSLLVVALLAW